MAKKRRRGKKRKGTICYVKYKGRYVTRKERTRLKKRKHRR